MRAHKKWLGTMSDNIEIFSTTNTAIQERVCSVAYTIDEKQPVLCTHIGDQPLFYIDEEIVEDEELFDPSELGLLEHEIQILQEEVNSFELAKKEPLFSSEDVMDAVEDFARNAESFAEGFSLSSEEQAERLEKILSTLEESRLAAAYLNTARKHDVKIILSEQVEQAFYDRRSGVISVYPHMDMSEQVILLSKELRRHWQHRQGALINPLMFQPEHAILINRAQEADLAVSVVRIAWELQLAGLRETWERVENSPLADLARAFARESFLDFRTINNGVASSTVFEAWFLSERCRQRDKQIIQTMLADHKGYVFESEAASKNVTVDLIAALGEMPFGKNYLAQHADVIMDDPVFTEIRDRSNANFLWFIKFERSYKEVEQHLQTEPDLSTHGIAHELTNEKGQGHHDENTAQSADVIQLFEYQGTRQRSGDKPVLSGSERGKHSADIIDLTRWAAKR